MTARDTHPAAMQRQVELMRAAGTAGRSAAARSLTRTVIALSRRALRRRMPDASEQEIGLQFVALHYGEDLARRVRASLAER